MTAPRLLAASVPASVSAADADDPLVRETAILLAPIALALLASELRAVLAAVRQAVARGAKVDAAVAEVWAAYTARRGAFRLAWRTRLTPALADAMTRAAQRFPSSPAPGALTTTALERAERAALLVTRTSGERVVRALRQAAAEGVTAEAEVAQRVWRALEGPTAPYRYTDAPRGLYWQEWRPYQPPAPPLRSPSTAAPRAPATPATQSGGGQPPTRGVAVVSRGSSDGGRPSRAARIAAQEAHFAVAGAEYLAADASGMRRVRWLHSGRPMEPRPLHVAMHGREVSLGARFENGCRFPRDPEGPADEVFGCTCSARFER